MLPWGFLIIGINFNRGRKEVLQITMCVLHTMRVLHVYKKDSLDGCPGLCLDEVVA